MSDEFHCYSCRAVVDSPTPPESAALDGYAVCYTARARWVAEGTTWVFSLVYCKACWEDGDIL